MLFYTAILVFYTTISYFYTDIPTFYTRPVIVGVKLVSFLKITRTR